MAADGNHETAIEKLIDATRDVHVATVNLQLDALPCPPTSSGAARKVVLAFGNGSQGCKEDFAPYYLTTTDPQVPGYSALQTLEKAQAALVEAQAALVKAQADPALLGVVPSTSARVQPGVPLEQQPMMVTVPDGLSGGQTLPVQTPAGMMAVQIPPGLSAGQTFQIPVPLPAQPIVQQPTALAAPVALEMQQG